MNYYNEIDPFAAEWLRNLIKEGLIPDGEVDTRSITDVAGSDLRQFTQCHFFAGIGGWSLALKIAGWPEDKEIWTGSCPCQPFSVAGKGKGKDDERHLWPHFFRLITAVRPPVVMGEQVAGAAGYGWFDGVSADLEKQGYASRAVDVPACAVNAPHIRQRLYWVAKSMEHADRAFVERRRPSGGIHAQHDNPDGGSAYSDMEHTTSVGWGEGRPEYEIRSGRSTLAGAGSGDVDNTNGVGTKRERPEEQFFDARCEGDMADANGAEPRSGQLRFQSQDGSNSGLSRKSERASFWRDFEWLTGADGKTRRAKPGVRLLVDGVPNRVGRLRGYGNAIVPPLAAEVIKAFMES